MLTIMASFSSCLLLRINPFSDLAYKSNISAGSSVCITVMVRANRTMPVSFSKHCIVVDG